MTDRDGVLVTAEELMGRLAAGERPVLLDVRWRLDRPDGRADHLAGHLPGAVYVSLEDELSDHTVTGRGRHPLPSGADLQSAARRWGISTDRPVIVYDDWNRAGSARAWWVLTAAGLTDVRILDGGLAAWAAAGGALETGPVTPAAGDVVLVCSDLYAGIRPTLTADEAAGGAVATLLDARAPERFAGAVEPIDPVAGHIPGAVNLPLSTFRASQLPDPGGKTLVLNCLGGKRSATALDKCAMAQAEVDTHLGGGFGAWVKAGLPVER